MPILAIFCMFLPLLWSLIGNITFLLCTGGSKFQFDGFKNDFFVYSKYHVIHCENIIFKMMQNCCIAIIVVLYEPAICEDLDIHFVIF